MKYIRQRYVLFEIITEDSAIIEKRTVLNKLFKQLSRSFGEHITFQAGLWLIRWDPDKKIGIIRCDNISKYHVLTIMGLITDLNNRPVIFHSRKTTGTVKKALKLWKHYFHVKPIPREK